ncbi:MAG: SWIM zinc finger family protein [Thermodesulfobacteriota bacterium]|jgi:hypothetical protein
MKATATVLAKVEDVRFRKAVEGVRKGAYQVTVTLRNDEEIRGLVKSPDGKAYGCTLTQAGAFCSCPDALYRGTICKHTVVLALYAVRNPPSAVTPAEGESHRPQAGTTPNLRLVKARRDFTFSP